MRVRATPAFLVRALTLLPKQATRATAAKRNGGIVGIGTAYHAHAQLGRDPEHQLLSKTVTTSRRNHRHGWRYRANVALRTLAGTAGAYGVAALAAAALARILPMARVEAVTTATMIAYLVAPAVTIWAFLARGPWRSVGGVLLAAVLLGGIAWMAGQPA